jgi:hypothetical protein
MIIASAVSYAAIRGITHGTRGGPGARGLGGLPAGELVGYAADLGTGTPVQY